MSTTAGKVFVTGATGYIGGRLVPRLLESGYRVVCISRSLAKLKSRRWADHAAVELVEGDVSDGAALTRAMTGCTAAYYFVHSMKAAGKAYRDVDRELARAFARAAETAGVARIIYLGGLGEAGSDLSEHLTSRREVEHALASTSVPVTTLRAAMIIGSGSASFEILRYLVERLPVMVTPKWVRTECQPVAVSDVLHVLEEVLDLPATVGGTFDVGGRDIMTYEEILQTVAEVLELRKRIIVPVPVLTPRLSSAWIHLVTPISHRLARPLAEGLRNRVVCGDDAIDELIDHRFLSVREAVEVAVASVRSNRVPTAWSDAGVVPGDPDWAGGTTFEDHRARKVRAAPETVFRVVSRMGGANGYFGSDWLWRLRGAMDRVAGGPGLRRGRRDPDRLAYGDALDFWRVTGVEVDRRVELRAEMKLPGDAVLELEMRPSGSEGELTILSQTARFKPRGLLGIVYWYLVMPLHGIVFETLLRGIAGAAEAESRALKGELAPASR